MKNIFLIIGILFTSIGYGREFKAQTSTPVYQPEIENSKTTANHFSERESQERSYIDTADDEPRTTSKPEKKRHLFAKTVLGLAGTFVVVVMIIWAIYGGPEFKY